jgi:pimeloyl-ACP methyl ester carboxylesterase
LLLVHGATSDHNTWRFILPALEKRFTVYAMDRRGRGGSGDAPAYDLQREAEDVAAVVSAIGGPVSVVGHSFGGLCSLEAARTTDMTGLVLYESVGIRSADIYPPGFIEKLEGKMAAGDAEGVVVGLLAELVEMPAGEIELLREQRDLWAARLANAPTIPRELRTERGYVFDAERFSAMRTPTLLLVGGDSPPRELTSAAALSMALQNASVVILPGQQHAAHYTAPELLVAELVRFMESIDHA